MECYYCCLNLIVIVRIVGGEAGGVSSLAPKVGPLGLSPKKVADDIAKATANYKGMRCTVKLIVQNRQAKVEVVPSAATLIIKALGEPERDRKKTKNSMEKIKMLTHLSQSSTMATCPWTKLLRLPKPCASSPWLRPSPELSRRFWEHANLSAALLKDNLLLQSSKRSTTKRSMSKAWHKYRVFDNIYI